MSIRNALSMSRKLSQYIVFSCQYPAQIDEGLKDYVDEIFYCNGVSNWSEKLRNESLIMKNCKRFTNENFKVWYADPKLRRNPFKTKILANKSWDGLISCVDVMTFEAYDSFVDFRKMKAGGFPKNDAGEGKNPLCHLKSQREHRLDYWPEEIQIAPMVHQESLELFYAQEEAERDIYEKVMMGETTFSPHQRRSYRKKEVQREFISQARTLVVWRVWGNNKIRLHKHSKFMSSLYKKTPGSSLKGLLKLDKLLSKLASKKYEYEILILKGVGLILGLTFLLHLFMK